MSAGSSDALVLRLEDGTRSAVLEVRALLGMGEGHDPRWRQHAPNLVTVRWEHPTEELEQELLSHPAVDQVIRLNGARLYSQWPGESSDRAPVAPGMDFDSEDPVVIAGPCSVEGRSLMLEIAQMVAEAGGNALRGGVFKPRTSPYDFAGLGEQGLEYMVEARELTGLPIVTEVLHPSQLDLVAEHADVLQIGSRNMHNTAFLFQLGAHPRGKPALLKRGFAATVAELLDAAEYFLLGRLAGGHRRPGLFLCERGIRTFEDSTRFTLDLGAFPILKKRTHLPVIADPSHSAGSRELVPALAHAALAAGASGMLVEAHARPHEAWCDSDQSLEPEVFRTMMSRLRG